MACDTMGSTAQVTPMPNMISPETYTFPSDAAASSRDDTWPTMIVSTTPMSMSPTWVAAIGTARRTRARMSCALGTNERTIPEEYPAGGTPRHSAVAPGHHALPIRREEILQELAPHVFARVHPREDGVYDARRAVHDVERRVEAVVLE